MESLKMQLTPEFHQTQLHLMNKFSSKLKPTIDIRSFCASCHSHTQNLKNPEIIVPVRKRRSVASSNYQLKENWLASISYSTPGNTHLLNEDKIDSSSWFLGIDPDVSGAVALLKIHDSVCSPQVPH